MRMMMKDESGDKDEDNDDGNDDDDGGDGGFGSGVVHMGVHMMGSAGLNHKII